MTTGNVQDPSNPSPEPTEKKEGIVKGDEKKKVEDTKVTEEETEADEEDGEDFLNEEDDGQVA